MHRRTFVAAGGLLAGTAIAGCLGDTGDETPDSGDTSDDKTTTEKETTQETSTEDQEPNIDSAEEELNFADQYPSFRGYNAHQVIIDIPPGDVLAEYSDGGEILIGLGDYANREIEGVGRKSFDSLSESETDTFTISVDTTGFPKDKPALYIANLITTSGSKHRDYLAESDRFVFEGDEAVRRPHELALDSRNAADSNAAYRREVAEGMYAIQLQGETDQTPWQFKFRMPKALYVETAAESDGSSLAPRYLIQNVIGDSKGGMRFHSPLASVADEYGFTGEQWLRFAADLVRTLPDMPAVNSGSEEPTKDIRQTLVEGGGDIVDLATVLAGLTVWEGYEAAILYAEDHAAVGVVGNEFDGYSRGDDPQHYWLEPTPIDGYVGVAPDEVQDVPTLTESIDLDS